MVLPPGIFGLDDNRDDVLTPEEIQERKKQGDKHNYYFNHEIKGKIVSTLHRTLDELERMRSKTYFITNATEIIKDSIKSIIDVEVKENGT
jgi:hypothetical protein